MEQVNAVDTKANFILGSATAIISAALILQAVLIQLHSIIFTNRFLLELPLLLLFITYLSVMFIAFLAYRINVYKLVPDPSELYKHYLQKPESHSKAEVFRAMVEAFKENERTINKKVSWTERALVALGCETVSLVLFLSLQFLY